ncbi:MAG TPA: RodZ domain-containing protein [Geminicoccaceae bacterium]
MREVGAQLREVRQERGEDLDDIAEYLRIKPIYLYGIERGDMGVMPGRTYALGFLRTYADYLGFDGEDLITQIRSTVDDLTGKTRFHIRAPLPESRLPKMPMLVLSIAMVAGIYAGWAYLNRDDDAGFEQVRPIPEATSPAPVPATPASPPPAPAEGRNGDGVQSRADAPAPVVGLAPRPAPAQGAQAANHGDAPSPGAGAGRPAGDGREAVAVGLADPAEDQDDADRLIERLQPEAGPAAAEDPPPGDEPAAEEGVASGPDPATADGSEQAAAGGAGSDGAAGRAADRDELGDLIAELQEPSSAGSAAEGLANQPPAGAGPDPAQESDAEAAGDADAGQPPAAAAAVEAVLAAAEADGDAIVHETVNADARVIVRALDQSWMQIRSLSGDYLRTRTLEAGDAFLVPNRDDLVLWTGNGGAIEFVVDGERVTPLGPDGSVIRDIPLEPEALLERARRPG